MRITDFDMYDTTKPASDPHNLTLIAKAEKVVGTSTDGHYVYYFASGQQIAGQPTDVDRAIYVWHDGIVRFIAGVAGSDDILDTTTTNQGEPSARATPDGLHLLFASTEERGPTGYDQGECGNFGCQELYLYSYPTQSLACVSCNPTGIAAGHEAIVSFDTNRGAAQTTQVLTNPLSDDGRYVFFGTAEALVSRDTNGAWDTYEYEADSGTVHLVSSGTDPSDSYFMNASPDGSNALFVSRERLTGSDGDVGYDLYDARVGGGFAEPPPSPSPCAGETCRSASPAPPAASSAGSSTLSGPGNPSPSRRCGKGRVRRHGHCVHKRHRRRRKRTASSYRGGAK